MRFDYVIDKIGRAPMQDTPFAHIEINDLFEEEDFRAIVDSPEVKIAPASNDADLFERLFDNGYRIIDFPGCITDHQRYIDWHRRKGSSQLINTACEGFGVVLRLADMRTSPIQELSAFLHSEAFLRCIADRFQIDHRTCSYDAGVQKYLDGYEISPHVDIRRKALTFMVNINPDPHSDSLDHHTHYLQFKPDRNYIREFWRGNPEVDTCWVPWSWCETLKQQTRNNSMVIFSPNSETLHGVKAKYDHLGYQRTQLYGNLWHQESPCSISQRWEDLDLLRPSQIRPEPDSLLVAIKKRIPGPIKRTLRSALGRTAARTTSTHMDRSN